MIWTTTPWTLPANLAVAVAPDVTYARVRHDGETLIVAEALVERVFGEGAEVVGRVPGSRARRRAATAGRSSPRDATRARASRSSPATSSRPRTAPGIVHMAPAFGEDDFRLGVANGLFDPTRPADAVQPGPRRRHLRRARDRLRGPLGASTRSSQVDLIADLRERGAAAARRAPRALLPALLALRHAADLLRQAVVVHRDLAAARPAARGERDGRLVPAGHQGGPLRRLAAQQRRLGALARALLGHAAAGLALRRRPSRLHRLVRRARAARRAARRRPAPPLRRRAHASPARSAAGRCAACRR